MLDSEGRTKKNCIVPTENVLLRCCVGVHIGHWRSSKAAGSRWQQQDRVTEHYLCVLSLASLGEISLSALKPLVG